MPPLDEPPLLLEAIPLVELMVPLELPPLELPPLDEEVVGILQ